MAEGRRAAVKRLTSKQQRFVAEYLIDLNATQAAARAGYKDPNKGRQLVTKSNVSEAIREAQHDQEKRTLITQDKVLHELAKVAFGDMRTVMEWGPQGVKLIDSGEISDDAAALVAEVSETVTESGGSIKMKANDKIRALELLGKHLGMFQDKVSLTGGLRIEVSYGDESDAEEG